MDVGECTRQARADTSFDTGRNPARLKAHLVALVTLRCGRGGARARPACAQAASDVTPERRVLAVAPHRSGSDLLGVVERAQVGRRAVRGWSARDAERPLAWLERGVAWRRGHREAVARLHPAPDLLAEGHGVLGPERGGADGQ